MTMCRESGSEDSDDLYPGNKPGQEQNFEIHSPKGPVNLSFQFSSLKNYLPSDVAASMVIRRKM